MLVDGKRQDTVSLNNRGLAYGDGLFETVLLHEGRPILLARHLARLQRGCARLGIPDCRAELEKDIKQLRDEFAAWGVLKIIVTRGAGGRGYQPREALPPTRILTLHPRPTFDNHDPQQGIKAFVCQQALAHQEALAGLKHLNRLEQVLASREWPDDPAVLEALMLDRSGHVIEGTRSNVFWVRGKEVYTPRLDLCGVEGVMREALIDAFGGRVRTVLWPMGDVLRADEMFFCNSVNGVWPVLELRKGKLVQRYRLGEFTRRAQQVFRELLGAHET